MIINNCNSNYKQPHLSFGCKFNTEKVVKCLANNSDARISERMNTVIEINSLRKTEALNLLKNKSKLGSYVESAKNKLYEIIPEMKGVIEKFENSNKENIPNLIETINTKFGDSIDLPKQRGCYIR